MNTPAISPARRGRQAFTLVELLVTIGLIGLLVAIIVPSLGRARFAAKRVTCAANLKDIAKACIVYAMDDAWHRGSDSVKQALPSCGPTKDNWADPEKGNIGSLWLLLTGYQPGQLDEVRKTTSDAPDVKHQWVSPAMLRCPATNLDEPKTTDKSFKVNTCSYGYLSQVPFGTNPRNNNLPYTATSILNANPSLVILADRNPNCTPGSQTWAAVDPTENSPNHGKEGQNAARLDGSVNWFEKPQPDSKEDNIYTPATGETLPNTACVRKDMSDCVILP